MIEEIYKYFSIEMLFFWINLGVIPFWLLLIFFPQSNLSRYFVASIFPFLILSGAYIFVLYKSYLNSFDFVNNFSLYLGIDSLSELFKDEFYLMMLWIHFISINLFTGGWIVKDSQKFYINKFIVAIPLIITYFIGPIGLLFYWLIKILYAKKINLYD